MKNLPGSLDALFRPMARYLLFGRRTTVAVCSSCRAPGIAQVSTDKLTFFSDITLSPLVRGDDICLPADPEAWYQGLGGFRRGVVNLILVQRPQANFLLGRGSSSNLPTEVANAIN